MNKYHIQIGQLFVCIAKYMHMHFRCLFYNMKILYTKSKVSEHSSWSRAARQPAKSRMRLASRRFATPDLVLVAFARILHDQIKTTNQSQEEYLTRCQSLLMH